MKISRRQFLKSGALAGTAMMTAGCPAIGASSGKQLTAILDPMDISKYDLPLVIPPAMPRAGKIKVRGGKNVDYYEIAIKQFVQQILPTELPPTTVWSYGSALHPNSFNYPAFTIEAKVNTPLRVKWINGLVDSAGDYLPHLLAVDQTLHWANPPGGIEMRDMRGMDPAPYTGPVPMVTHVHGAHVDEEGDGYPEAWFLPDAANIPTDYATVGSWYDQFKAKFEAKWQQPWTPGSAVFQYANDQRATTLWYHDHTLGMTRLNVYAGPAGFYLLRGGPTDAVGGLPRTLSTTSDGTTLTTLPAPAPALGDPPGTRYYEIPIVIQDRSFNDDGSLFFPDSREYFDGFSGPYIPDSDISPIWNPEFFGNTIVANGRTWPFLTVEPRRYRFRLLNGCNSRFFILKMVTGDATVRPGVAALPFWQIGAEGGFLPAPVMLDSLLIAPAERADMIVDFTGLPQGTKVFLINEGPDEPFGGGIPGTDFEYADPLTTGQVMKFVVGPLLGHDTSLPPDKLNLPAVSSPAAAVTTRDVTLNEQDSAVLEDVGPRAALLGTLADGPLEWMAPVTENPMAGDTEIWNIHNFTMDAHPIHVHQVMFQVLGRTDVATGVSSPPEPAETGFKDTVIAYPDEVTTITARFDLPGRYVWHCHIIDHEDNEMMRPYHVGPLP